MKTEDLLDAEAMLEAIEQEPFSFTIGRRNDDLVNWFLAKRLIEVLTPGGPTRRPMIEYVRAFEVIEKSDLQKSSLRDWCYDGMSAELKIRQLHQHYGFMTNPQLLRSYWIPMSYRTPAPV
jgi:hypothetical protein